MIFRYLSQKIKSNRTLRMQALFVALAFIVMVTLSYSFMSRIVRGNLIRNADNVLDVTGTRISSRLSEFETVMENFSDEMRGMVMRGEEAGALKEYIDSISRFTFMDGSRISGIQGFYGYFEALPEGPVFIAGDRRSLPGNVNLSEYGWYRRAVEANGNIVETTPTISDASETRYTYAKSLLDDEGRRLGVVCMDVKIDDIGKEVISTALNQGGYGMLMNQDLLTMFHPNPGFVGVNMEAPFIPIHIFADDLRNGRDIFEHPLTSYRNEKSVAFFRKLSNGWYLGLVTPERQYYATMNNMAITLFLLGLSLAAALIGILVRIDKARAKSDDENKKKSMFLANMSHEIRTPLNAVVGLSELALDGARLDSDTEDKLEKIHDSGMTILSIVNDILDISKLESGKFELNPIRYDIPSLINDTVTLNIVRIEGKPITFKLDVDENLPGSLTGDDLRVKQIFNNLLSNAFKYTHSGTVEWRITFERERNDIWLIAAVKDSGIGIKPEDMQKLFSDFNQVDTKANRKVEGTGLGLAITKRLVEMMDGTVTAESDYGKGTTFHVRLRQTSASDTPIGKEVAENLMDMRYTFSKRDRNTKLARIDLSYAHVLIVDDIATNLDVVKGMMKPYGMKIDCAASGPEAIEMIRAGNPRYGAIFMDHMMPGMDGIEATRIIRENIGTDYARNIPVIALTANAIVGNEDMFLSHGFQAFISKPIDMMKLDSVLRQWVRDKQQKKTLWRTGEGSCPPGDKNRAPANSGSSLTGITISGADISRALDRFSGDGAVLINVLHSYAANTPPLLSRLRDDLEAGNLEDYAVVVHGIKGSSYGIFAQGVGKAAEALEMSAKAGHFNAVKAGHAALEKTAEVLLNELARVFNEVDSAAGKPVAAEPDPALLKELREACAAFDMDRVDKAMLRLESFRYETGEKLVAWLREQIGHMAFEEIASGQWPPE